MARTLIAHAPTNDALGRGATGDPWQGLAAALPALAAAPDRADGRLLVAAHALRLGLPTLARWVLEPLPAAVGADPELRRLRALLAELADDHLDPDGLRRVAHAHVDRLEARGVALRRHLPAWEQRLARTELLRAADGNIVRRARGTGRWWIAGDVRGHCCSAPLPFLDRDDDSDPTGHLGPLVIDGLDPPCLLERIHERTPPRPDGYAPMLLVVQRDPLEMIDGLVMLERPALLDDERVALFIGPDAESRVRDHLVARLDCALPTRVVRTPGVRTPAAHLETVLRNTHAAQASEQRCLVATANEQYPAADRAARRARFEAAARGAATLRVLIPVSRFSTYVRHAAADLAAALGRLGHEARVLTEPDDHHVLGALARLRDITTWRPDLVVLINHTRRQLAGTLPAELPVVCWIQDQMPHLFTSEAGTPDGADFVAGCIPPQLPDGPGPTRRLLSPVVTTSVRFHDAPIPAAERRAHACEIAYVSHQSETPERLHERFVASVAPDDPLRRPLEGALDAITGIVARAMDVAPSVALLERAEGMLREADGRSPDPRAVALVLYQWLVPLADRCLRHETLQWAAELAERHGWRFRIHGRGWERHPRLAPFAVGPCPHGEPLRAVYQAAAVNLHLSITTVVHQRVMECALSGGLPLCRLTMNDLVAMSVHAQTAAAARPERLCGHLELREHVAWNADHPELMRLVALRQRLGIDQGHAGLTVPAAFLEPDRGPLVAPEMCADWLLGDVADMTFRDRDSLEERVRDAIERPEVRARRAALVARRVRARLTHETFATRLIDLVAGGL